MTTTYADELDVLDNPWGVPTWLTNMPWWFISAGIHLVILLIATLVTVERLMAVEDAVVITAITRPPAVLIDEPVRTGDNFVERGIPHDDELPATEEPRIFFPGAEESDRNRSNDGEDFDQMKGQSKDYKSYLVGDAGGLRGTLTGKNPGAYATLGIGGGEGGPGRYGGRIGSNRDTVSGGPPYGKPTKETENAVLAALKWLARHQNPDGSWGAATFSGQCVGTKCDGPGDANYDTGVTGLALLAFLGGGYTHLSRDTYDDPVVPGRKLRFGQTVKEGLKWLLARQDPEGCLGPRGDKYMYNHTIAALALCEAYGMTATQNFRGPSQRAIDFIVAAQNPGRAWRYSFRCGDNDTSVTGWAVMALKSAELADLPFPKSCFDGARAWLVEAMEPTYYASGYNARYTGAKTVVPGKNDAWENHESMTAVAVLSRIFMMKDHKDPALGGARLIVKDLPVWKKHWVDFYYWYYASLALFQYDGTEGPYWRRWNEKMKEALVPHQEGLQIGCPSGSWNPAEDRWGFEGGRVYAVAINALTLEVYYRYQNVFGGTRK
jgi:hypothetical protein